MVGSHISLVLLVTLALSHSFLGQLGSSLASVVRLWTFCYGCLEDPKFLDPKFSAQKATDHAGLQEAHIAPILAQPAPQNLTETDLKGNSLLTGYRSLINLIKPFMGLCSQKARSLAVP